MSSNKGARSQPFLWGAATSGHQVDGDNRNSDWWAWEAQGFIDGGVRSGRAADHWRRFREDLRLAREFGMTSYRFSFEWARLEPREGEWCKDALAWYDELVTECERLGLVPMATLHHFSLPQWFAEQGGFSSPGAPEKFIRYTERVATAFGRRIPLWCTLNEPMVLVVGSYLGRFMPPGEYDPEAASRACLHLLQAHIAAYDILRSYADKREGVFGDRPLEVGFAHNMLDFVPERVLHPIESFLSWRFSALYNDAWLEAVSGNQQKFGCFGLFPQAPEFKPARGRRSYDFIGVNYYTKAYVQWRPRTHAKERVSNLPLGLSFAKRKELASDLGWAIHPLGLRRLLRRLRRYKAPIYITENGLADAADQHRCHYLVTHLREVARAHAQGLDIRGYYHWSLIDNFEWIKGFWPRFGLCAVNYESLERQARPSAYLYRDIIHAHPDGMAPDLERMLGL